MTSLVIFKPPHQGDLFNNAPSKTHHRVSKACLFSLLTEADERPVPLLFPIPLKQRSCRRSPRSIRFTALCKYRSQSHGRQTSAVSPLGSTAVNLTHGFSLPVATF